MKKILLLEDDIALNEIVSEFLQEQGYKVLRAFEPDQAEDLIYENSCDLMILDVKLPKISGFEFLRELRKNGNKTPAIFATSLNSVDDLEVGFEVGCDDYLKKPFELKELRIRIEALLRRALANSSESVAISDQVHFFPDQLRVENCKKSYHLAPKEAKLLEILLQNRPNITTQEEIVAKLWDFDEEPSLASLRTHLKNLRKIVGSDLVETIRGIGYRLV